METKIIYSAKIMRRLLEMGDIPIRVLNNPDYPDKFKCWEFEITPKFVKDAEAIFGERKDGD